MQTEADMKAQGNEQNKRICTSCGTSSTPLWRRNAARELVCNACGLYMKANNQKRPDGLKNRNIAQKTPPLSKDTDRDMLMDCTGPQQSNLSYSPKNSRNLSCSNCYTAETPLWRRDPITNDVTCNACGLYYRIHNHHRPAAMNGNSIRRKERWDETIHNEGAESLISLHAAHKPGFHRRSYSFNGPQLISPPSSPSPSDDDRRHTDYMRPLPPPSLPSLEMYKTSEAMKSLSMNSSQFNSRLHGLGAIPSFPKIGKSRHSKTSSDLTSYAFSHRTPPVLAKITSRHAHSRSEIVLPASNKMSISNMLS